MRPRRDIYRGGAEIHSRRHAPTSKSCGALTQFYDVASMGKATVDICALKDEAGSITDRVQHGEDSE
jgi:hypothetical protein